MSRSVAAAIFLLLRLVKYLDLGVIKGSFCFFTFSGLVPLEATRSDGREALCLPNLLAGGLPAGALPGLVLASDKRAQYTHATQKSTAQARHTKRDVWVCTGDITAAIEMGGRRANRYDVVRLVVPSWIDLYK